MLPSNAAKVKALSNDYFDAPYLSMMQSLPAAVYTCDMDGYITFYNQAAAVLWGREPELGKDLWCGSWKIFTPLGEQMTLDCCPMAKTLKEKIAVIGEEIVVERPGGERRHILPHPKPMYNEEGEMIGALNMLVDVTENKNIQEANKQLKNYNEQLEQFAFATSHDLQEPLRKIRTYCSLLAIKNNKQLNDDGKAYLNKISESSGRLSSLLHDLLTYSQESSSDDLAVAVDLNEVVANACSDLELFIDEKQANITCKHLPVIMAVPVQMSRLFYNLLNNALKYSKETTTPEISITYKHYTDFIQLTITDNGIGFDMMFAEKIFNLFNRLHSKQSYSGNGIGLSLCKKIVENHNGKISAFSRVGEFSSFRIQFPSTILL